MRVQVGQNEVFLSTGSREHVESAPSIVFVHGAGMDHTVWVMPSRYFARNGYNVAAVDLPGHGLSAGKPMESISELAEWLATVVETLRFTKPVVVGHSMGSLVAWEFAARYESNCQGIALLGPSIPMPVTPPLLEAAENDPPVAYSMANTWSHSSHGRLGANTNPGIWMFGSGEQLLHRARPGVFYADLTACNEFESDDVKLTVPVLFLLGAADQMTPPRAGRSLAASVTDAQVRELSGCGHSMLSEQPNAVLDELVDFVKACSSRSAST